MEKEKLQQIIRLREKTCAQMLEIAKSYLHGDVLEDPVAAEAWLLRVIRQGDSLEAVRATELLADEIFHEGVPVSDADYADMQHALKSANAGEREVIAEWMKLYEKQKRES